jgi:Transposase DDE domain group 1
VVEDDAGLFRPGTSPSTRWLELVLIGIDLIAWTQTLLLDGEHALAEPKKLRYRILHVAARIVSTARRTCLRIAQRWPGLATAYARLAALP